MENSQLLNFPILTGMLLFSVIEPVWANKAQDTTDNSQLEARSDDHPVSGLKGDHAETFLTQSPEAESRQTQPQTPEISSDITHPIPASAPLSPVAQIPITQAPELSDLPPVSTQAADLIAQETPINDQVVEITGVNTQTTATGIDIQLETPAADRLRSSTQVEGNTLITEIENAILDLPGGQPFRQQNPTTGISEVTVTQVQPTQIQVRVTGVEAAPVVNVTSGVKGVVLAVTPGGQEEEVEITVTADKVLGGYLVPNASTATGTDTPILETPFSVQIVPKEVIRDQRSTSVEEALRNVSGVTFSGNDGGRDTNIGIRGFGTGFNNLPLLRDGFRQYGSFQGIPEVANLEQIEVLKGPSSILYGQIEPGGILNLVSKRPLAEPFYELELQAGNRDRVQPRIDFSGPLTEDGSVLYRLNALYKHENSFRDFDAANNRFSVAPSLAWKISDRTQVDVSLEYIHDDGPADFGVTRFGTGVAPIPRDRVINNPDDTITTDFLSLGYRFEHQFSDDWKIRNGFRYLRYAYNYSVLALPFIVNDANVTRFYADQDGVANSYSLYTNVVGKFDTGSVKHTLLAGVDLNQTDDRVITLFDIANPSTINIFNPDYNAVPKPLRSALPPFGDTKTTSKRLGVYLQDQVNLLDNLILVAGVRYDTIEQTTSNIDTAFTTAGEVTQSDSAFTPRFGLLYQPIKAIALFTNYSQSFNPNTATTTTGAALEPERGEGFEFGVKTELFNQKLLATLTYFNLTKNNIAAADPNFPLASIAIGQQKSQGIEFDLAGEILPGWKIIGSYAYIDAKVTEDTNLANIATVLQALPKTQ
ncbi:MAG: TonB-dependent siderophore receptor [Acaryochloris sp. SU_5_25]|nr:TonB-dependent siderophore receptor [Acaryochloris sp. SU_5_25]